MREASFPADRIRAHGSVLGDGRAACGVAAYLSWHGVWESRDFRPEGSS
jgi:hypothetical protein